MIGGFRGDDETRCLWISWFVVHRQFRGSGIGRALWERLWTEFRALHSANHPTKPLLVGLSTGKHNTMRRFYERAGFLRLRPPGCLNSPWDMLMFKGN